MRLKRLEIQGFKSFKDKTVIYFDRPITGIVGPNGSGKSNIVDAFFWVMGEQSYKHIRSSGSSDIIFNGSSKYAPLGMAEATLVMEHDVLDTENAGMGASSDDSVDPKLVMQKKEISVTRRVYRDGEGEYFINGVQARLKDIQELFLDTGVGAKGYSVIEQGQISKVVNSKPEELRLLIEDAAGIAKYKARKKESYRKLEAAQGNLMRLQDVLTEIERSLGSLERQAQKARRYQEYRSELLEKETTWGRKRNAVLKRQAARLLADRTKIEQDLVGIRAELSTCEAQMETNRVLQLTDSKAQELLQSEVENFVTNFNHHQSALTLSRQRQEDLNRQLVQLQAEQAHTTDEIQLQRDSLTQKSEDFTGIDEQVASLAARLQILDARVRDLRVQQDQYKHEAEMKRREFVQLTEQSSQSRSQIAALEERMQGAQTQATRLLDAMKDSSQDHQDLQTRLVADRERFATQSMLRDAQVILLGEQKEHAQTLEGELKASKIAADQALKNHSSLASRLNSLEELEAAREGMAEGPKKVLEWARSSDQSFAVLSDFIEVEAGYESAVEAVLGHAFERLYVQDPEAAFQALQYLRTENLGSASIQVSMPLIRSRQEVAVHNPLKKHLTLICPQGQTHDSAQAVHELLLSLVESVEVLEEVPNMGDIQSYQQENISFVTKNGIWFDALQGVLFGGCAASDQVASLLSRKRVIQDLMVESAQAEAHSASLEEKVAILKEDLDLATQAMRVTGQSLNELEVEVGALDRAIQQDEKRENDLHRLVIKMQQEQDQYQEQAIAARAKILEIESSISGATEARSNLEIWIRDHEGRLVEKETEFRIADDELQAMRVMDASERERKNSLRKEIETEQRFILERERRLAEVTRLLEDFQADREQFSGGDDEHSEAIATLSRSLSEKREELSIMKDRLEQITAQINVHMNRIKELHQIRDEQSASVNQWAIEGERVASELNHLTVNMEEKYGVGCLEAVGNAPTIQEEMNDPVVTIEMSETEESVLRDEVEVLRDKIRRLGEVNTMAVEEYDEMQKRFEHLRAERDDLNQSIQNLNDAIEHINFTSIDRFTKAFTAIAERFEKLFPIIFGGGMASLTLTYPEGSTDILEAGVDILAQPPGKKISNMVQLSGGEKALTAISLIFAIFMVKPSPFCILDEVDAPLDDTNIGKFNALVREMSAKSQFILVTHNKKTMELNDALYGVTMEEPGVSRMISIQLQ